MIIDNKTRQKLENFSLRSLPLLQAVTIEDEDGVLHTPTSITLEPSKYTKDIEFSHDDNFETDGTYSYSLHIKIHI